MIEVEQKVFWLSFGLHIFILFCLDKLDGKYFSFDSDRFAIFTISTILICAFLLSYIFCVIGCFIYCHHKGYPCLLGILGLLSIFGLSILFLLPNRNKKKLRQNNENVFEAIDIMEIGCGYFAIYWGFGLLIVTVLFIVLGNNFALQKSGIFIYFTYFLLRILFIIWIFKQDSILELDQDLFFGERQINSIKKYFWLIIILEFCVFLFNKGLNRITLYYLSFLFPDYVVNYINDRSFTNVTSFVFFAISAIIFAPILEEFICRGLMLHKWSIKWSVRRAILVSSLLFALVHFRHDFISLWIAGVLLSVLYLKTKNLAIPILLHFFHNLLVVIFNGIHYFGTPLAERNSFIKLIEIQESLQSSLGQSILFLSISTPFLIYFIYKNFPKNNTQLPYFANIAERQ